jgi:DKNYY family
MKKLLPFLLLTGSLIAQQYKHLPCGLYAASNGSLAFKSEQVTDDEGRRMVLFIDHFYPVFEDSITTITYLKDVIDTASFQFLNYCFWKDKNHIYTFTPTSSGGTLNIAGFGDPATFAPLSPESRYAKDKDGVYYYIYGKIEGADPQTFTTLDEYPEGYMHDLARDKRYYYRGATQLDMHTIYQSGLDSLLISLDPKIPLDWHTAEPDFKNQGEQENYWAYRLFREQYEPQEYPKYSGFPIRFIGNVIEYGSAISQVNYTTPALRSIFTSGLFYPQLIGHTNVNANNLQELEFISTPQVKRYRFWLSRDGFMNPKVYFFELQNPNATENTATEDFIKGAKLTFVKEGWIII